MVKSFALGGTIAELMDAKAAQTCSGKIVMSVTPKILFRLIAAN
jgi:hypothetical protein